MKFSVFFLVIVGVLALANVGEANKCNAGKCTALCAQQYPKINSILLGQHPGATGRCNTKNNHCDCYNQKNQCVNC